MKKNSKLNALLRKASRLQEQMAKAVNDPYYWLPQYERRYNALCAKKQALKEEFAAIGYKFSTYTYEVTEMA